MDLSALSEDERRQAEDIQRRFQEHQQQQQSIAQQFQPHHEQQGQFQSQSQSQSYYHSNQAYDQPYQQPYGEYYQYRHQYYHYQQQQSATPSIQQNNVGTSYSQYVYYQQATPADPQAPVVATESTASVGHSLNAMPNYPELNLAPAVTMESTAHIGYSSIHRPPYLEMNPVAAATVAPMAEISYSSAERPACLELNSAHPGAMESTAHIGYNSVERPVRSELNPAPSVAIESTVRIGYLSTERPAQVDLNPAVAAALAEINKLAETIDIAQRTAAAMRTTVRLHGGGSSVEHVLGNGHFHGSSHSSVSYSLNNRLPAGGGRGRSKNKSVKNGAHLASGISTSISNGSGLGQVGTKDPHKKPSSSVPKKAVEAKVWRCDLCKVECNSKEILEQHESGKKHKKNLERLAEEGRIAHNGPVIVTSNEQKLPSASNEVVMGEDANNEQNVVQYLPPVRLDPWQDPPADPPAESHPEAANFGSATAYVVQPPSLLNPCESQRTGTEKKKKSKKKKKKKIAAIGGVQKPRIRKAPHERKIVIPLSCHVCNIQCDTQEVLNKHFAGKKHMANLKRYQGSGHQQPVYGATGLQALYPSNPMSQGSVVYPSQGPGYLQQEPQQAYYDPQVMYHPPQGTYQ